MKVAIVGGHGKVAQRITRLLVPKHNVISIIRDSSQTKAISALGAKPLVLSLEEASVAGFSREFKGVDVVYFCAGASGKGGEERTEAVDYKGAIKVFDAIEGVEGVKPRLILMSALDIRHPENIPDHYNEEDRSISSMIREAMPAYIKWKYAADKELVKRTAFKWTIARPGGLADIPAKGKAAVGRTHLMPMISRDDAAEVMALLVDREDASGLAIDISGGETPLEEGLDKTIKKGETDFLG